MIKWPQVNRCKESWLVSWRDDLELSQEGRSRFGCDNGCDYHCEVGRDIGWEGGYADGFDVICEIGILVDWNVGILDDKEFGGVNGFANGCADV